MKEQVLAMLIEAGDSFLSGEAISTHLGVSRAAVWKNIEALRQDGYEIESAPRRGYRISSAPDRLTAGGILPWIQCPQQREQLICLESVDSTNNYCKTLAMKGTPGGTAVVANEQTSGRGRLGRTFQSPKNKGIYLSVLYRPKISPMQAVNLTAYVAVAVCDGIEAAVGLRPGIKWTNDLVLNGKKLCGILTEMAVEGETGALQYIVTGIGINANHAPGDLSPEIEAMATSLFMALGHPVNRSKLCASVLNALSEMYTVWTNGGGDYWVRYRQDCMTLGKPVQIIRPGSTETAFAEDLDRDFGLIVRHPDGRRETITSGEVSVRGLCGYAT